jgi:hypothetical protein
MSDDEEEEPTRPIGARLEPRLIGQTYNHQLEYCHNLIYQTQPDPSMNKEYTASDAMLTGILIGDLNSKITVQGASFAQQYLLKVFGDRAHGKSRKEVNQLHRRNYFSPISITEMTQSERRKAQQVLMFMISQKRDGTILKDEWFLTESLRENAAALESIMITAFIDAVETRRNGVRYPKCVHSSANASNEGRRRKSNDENYRSAG